MKRHLKGIIFIPAKCILIIRWFPVPYLPNLLLNSEDNNLDIEHIVLYFLERNVTSKLMLKTQYQSDWPLTKKTKTNLKWIQCNHFPQVGSTKNLKHRAGGGNVKVYFCVLSDLIMMVILGQQWWSQCWDSTCISIIWRLTSDKIFVLIYVVHVTWAMTHALWLMI